MTKHYLPVTILAGFVLGLSAWAQSPQPPAVSQDAQPGANDKTIVGCLTKGTGERPYIIADSKTGEKVSFAAPDKIETYLNQIVQLTGQDTMEGGHRTFVPQTVKTISTSCEKQ